MVDKKYCMSSYMAFRYIEADDKDFYEGMKHKNLPKIEDCKKTSVKTAKEIDEALSKAVNSLKDKKCGILLSGGMDSAIVASYMSGCDAYTFRFLNGNFQKSELERAEYYAKYYGLNLHYVDIDWDSVSANLDAVMKEKCAPVHSIEPQIMQAAMQAKADGIEVMLIGNGSDYVFGGMDQLLSRDWSFDDFVKRYIYIDPAEVLVESEDMTYAFEEYRTANGIDYIAFMNDVAIEESYSSYANAFNTAGMDYVDPYASLIMAEPLDLNRIRNGESKYLIRELFAMKYPEMVIPEKVPMPRPVDEYFKNWEGPVRPEFKKNLDMSKFSGNQKWQLYCLERFLNMCEK